MAKKKEISFFNELSFNTWKGVQGPNIRVIKHSPIIEEWAYPTSARLSRPRIYVEYLDYREFEDNVFVLFDFVLHLDGVPLSFDGGYIVYNG